jgi:conjugal transfer pilus assembly protein TraK
VRNNPLLSAAAGVAGIASLAYADEGPGYGVVLDPERPAAVEMSNRDINRIVCAGGDFEDFKFSGEKGIVVEAAGENAFVKFQIVEIGSERQYVTARSEFFFRCGGEMFTVFGNPRDIPAQTIFLGRLSAGGKANAALFNPMSDEERAVSITRAVLKEETGVAISRVALDEPYEDGIIAGADVRRRQHFLIEGSGMRAAEFLVRASRDLFLNEMMFVGRTFGPSIYAVTVEQPQLKAGEVGRVVIVYRGASAEEVRR